MTDPEGVRAAITAGELSVSGLGVEAHLTCCASKREAEAVRLVLLEEFLTTQAAQIMGCSASNVRGMLTRFVRKVKRCEERRQLI